MKIYMVSLLHRATINEVENVTEWILSRSAEENIIIWFNKSCKL